MRELGVATRASIASELGIAPKFITPYLLAEIERDPSVLEHVEACKHDEEMLTILVRLGRTNISPAETTKESVWKRIISRKKLLTSDETYVRRLEACQSCEHAADIPLAGGHRCRLCGCVVEWKAKLQNEVCPDSSWGEGGRWL
jgi:hypothetical protein